jgi:GWxTD domain-containing protein
MMKKALPAMFLAASLMAGAAVAAGAEVKIALPEKYRKWLEEEVVYIIGRHERDVFLQLKTDRERDIFIEAFWKQRDPTPGTPQNEFREEHGKRLEYANKIYGRSSPLPGWKTDRGRIYIILGPPRNIEQYTNVNGVYPTEIWFYMGDASLGLPTAFNVIFFKRNGVGDYIFYSPTNDGPRSLVAESMGGFRDLSQVSSRLTDDEAAYQALKRLEPTLAPQVLSLIPGQQTLPGMESLASIKLIADIAALPGKKVTPDYADALLKYKDFVEVEYTANYVPSEASLQVIQEPSGGFLVHYTIEPAKITAEQIGEKYEVRFELTGRVSDARGKTVYQFDKDFPFSLTAAELEEVRSKSISVQDAFPLVPGTYNLDILLKNTLSKEFTGAGKSLVVPGAVSSPQMSPLLLAYGAEKKPSPPGERVPFKSGDQQILCQTRKTYARKDTLVIFFQLFGLTDELRSSGSLRYVYLREDKEVSSTSSKIGDERTAGEIVELVPLKDFTPGYYQVRVSLLDGQGREVAAGKENFEISFAPVVPRPLVVSKVVASVRSEDDLYITGVQYMNTGDLATARFRLAQAYAKSPQRPDIAVAYSQVLFRLSDFGGVKEVLLPFAGGEQPPAEVLALLGQACHALGEFQEALTHYAGYLSRYGANIDILNYLGTCYFQLGNREEALRAWTRSLELSPNQEKIKSLVESLKKK